MSEHIEQVWEFRAGCHNADDVHAQPCACANCATKRHAAVAEQPELDDDAYVQFVGDKTKYSVRELRSAAGVEQLRGFERELRRRDPGFMRIVSTDDGPGKGTYETRETGTDDSRTVTKSFTFSGDTILTPKFAPPLNADYTPPNPYEPGITAMRAASATDLSRFEEQYKIERTREIEQTRAAIDAHPRLTAAELAEIPAPPDSYKADLVALRAKESR